MDKHLEDVFNSVPADPPRSRLEPYRELILRWKRQGRSSRRIRELLTEKVGITVAHATLHGFIERRSRPRKAESEPEVGVVTAAAAVETKAHEPSSPQFKKKYTKLSPEEAESQREFLRALRDKPAVDPSRDTRPVFRYDPSKPLIIDKTIKVR